MAVIVTEKGRVISIILTNQKADKISEHTTFSLILSCHRTNTAVRRNRVENLTSVLVEIVWKSLHDRL